MHFYKKKGEGWMNENCNFQQDFRTDQDDGKMKMKKDM